MNERWNIMNKSLKHNIETPPLPRNTKITGFPVKPCDVDRGICNTVSSFLYISLKYLIMKFYMCYLPEEDLILIHIPEKKQQLFFMNLALSVASYTHFSPDWSSPQPHAILRSLPWCSKHVISDTPP